MGGKNNAAGRSVLCSKNKFLKGCRAVTNFATFLMKKSGLFCLFKNQIRVL